MSKSNATETAILELVFTAVAPAWDGATQLDLHLHTADPGEAGTSATSEATYTGYTVVTVARAGSAWTVVGDSVSNDNLIQFPLCTAGANTITHASVTGTTVLYVADLFADTAGTTPYAGAGAERRERLE